MIFHKAFFFLTFLLLFFIFPSGVLASQCREVFSPQRISQSRPNQKEIYEGGEVLPSVKNSPREKIKHRKNFINYDEARLYIQSQGLKTAMDFKEWSRSGERPWNFPSAPQRVYKEEWESWGAFLGIWNKQGKNFFMGYEEAKSYVQELEIQSKKGFIEWSQSGLKPIKIPSSPQKVYKGEWEGWGVFLGTGNVRKKDFMSYDEAKLYVQKRGIKSRRKFIEWSQSGERPGNFPYEPPIVYKEEWEGWGVFLGTGNVQKKDFMSYEEAKSLVQELGLKSSLEFKEWGGQRPWNFPSDPPKVYKEEWKSWKAFFGLENRRRRKDFMSYDEARLYIQEQGIKSQRKFEEWSRSGERPWNFPSDPQRVYKGEWESWGAFFGTGNKKGKKDFMSYKEAKSLVQELGLKSSLEFREWSRSRPGNFPSDPSMAYKGEWESWGAFFGTGNSYTKDFMSYEEAKSLVRELGLKSSGEFREWSRSGERPWNFPSDPSMAYKGEWESWGAFFGTGNSYTKDFMSYEEAKSLVRELGLKSSLEFREWSRLRPGNFPSDPSMAYKGEWEGWKVFLGTAKSFMGYEEAKLYAQSLGLKSSREFKKWRGERPWNFPYDPSRVYKGEWEGWGAFLGTENVHKKDFMSYKEAQSLVQELGLKSSLEFIKWSQSGQRPWNFPYEPFRVYKGEWEGWGVFLGTGNVQKKDFIRYGEAKLYIQSLGIKTHLEFREWSRSGGRPENFPSNPHRVYKKLWEGWPSFLGRKKKKKWKTYNQAKNYIRKQDIKTYYELIQWLKSDQRPKDFPPDPQNVYSDHWQGPAVFLGIRWLSFKEAIKIVQLMNLASPEEYKELVKSREWGDKLPFNPVFVYKTQWQGWDDFLHGD